MFMSLLRAAVGAGAFVVALVASTAPSTANAQGITITIGAPNLSIDRVLIEVPVTVSCQPFDATLTQVDAMVSVSVNQASGQKIAHGSGISSGFLGTAMPFSCDGADHAVTVAVLADPAGPPFHGGPAVLMATAFASAGIPCFPDSTTCFSIFASQSGTFGPSTVSLH
jgi:hypothetical protein